MRPPIFYIGDIMQFINTLKDGDRLSSIYHIKTKSQATAKTGKEYFNVQLLLQLLLLSLLIDMLEILPLL